MPLQEKCWTECHQVLHLLQPITITRFCQLSNDRNHVMSSSPNQLIVSMSNDVSTTLTHSQFQQLEVMTTSHYFQVTPRLLLTWLWRHLPHITSSPAQPNPSRRPQQGNQLKSVKWSEDVTNFVQHCRLSSSSSSLLSDFSIWLSFLTAFSVSDGVGKNCNIVDIHGGVADAMRLRVLANDTTTMSVSCEIWLGWWYAEEHKSCKNKIRLRFLIKLLHLKTFWSWR